MGAMMSSLASLIGGEAAATGATAAVADTAGKAATTSLTSAAEMGWQPQSYLKGMDFGIGNYQGTTQFAAGEQAGIPQEVGGFEEEGVSAPSLGAPPTASIQSAPGIQAGSFGGQSMLGDISMTAGLDGTLGKKTTDMIAASANKFKANPVAQVPGLRI